MHIFTLFVIVKLVGQLAHDPKVADGNPCKAVTLDAPTLCHGVKSQRLKHVHYDGKGQQDHQQDDKHARDGCSDCGAGAEVAKVVESIGIVVIIHTYISFNIYIAV